MILIKADRAGASFAAAMSTFSAAADGPRFEMSQIGRTQDDLMPGDTFVAPPGGEIAPVIWTAVGIFALVAFVGALLAL